MGETLFSFLQDYTAQDIYPFHMPGNKRNPAFIPAELVGMDITELPGADNLNQPETLMVNLQERLSRFFGAEQTFFTVNGSTGGNLAVITTLCGDGGTLALARNSHRSAFGALILSGSMPAYIMPDLTSFGFCGGIKPEDVKKTLSTTDDVRAVFLTSPTYEGIVSDIAAIADIAHSYGIPLVVDEAHGAHMSFSDEFPRSALACGADIVIHSLHKTLPFLTQTSAIHVQGPRVDRMRLKRMVSILQTSSPSYLFTGQADYAVSILEREGEAIFKAYTDRLAAFRRNVADLQNIKLFGKEIIGSHGVFDMDLNKLVFAVNVEGMSGNDFELALRDRFKVQLEMSGLKHSLALTSPADTDEGYERLLRGVRTIDAEAAPETSVPAEKTVMPAQPEIIMTPRHAIHSDAERIPMDDALGRIAAEFLIPYPPGIPLAAPGERLTKDVFAKLRLCLANGIPVMGLGNTDHSIAVVR